jgi:hypothetical protein
VLILMFKQSNESLPKPLVNQVRFWSEQHRVPEEFLNLNLMFQLTSNYQKYLGLPILWQQRCESEELLQSLLIYKNCVQWSQNWPKYSMFRKIQDWR